MPKIRRWFPVSHDINADPEVWELTDRFGDRALRVWLEILSIADRNEGVLKGTVDNWVKSLLRVYHKSNPKWVRRDSERLQSLIRWLSERLWIEIRNGSDPSLRIRNFADYHRTRATKRILSEPSEPSDPNKSTATPPVKDEKPKKNGQQGVFKLAQELSGGDRQRARELCAFVGKTVKEGIKFGDSEEVINDGIIYTLEALKARAQKEGHPITEDLLWPYLQKTYQFKRTRALETEAHRYKREPLQSAGSVLRAVMRSAP